MCWHTVYKSDESIAMFALFKQLLLSLQFILSTRLKFDFELIFLRNLKVKTKRDYAVLLFVHNIILIPLNTLLYIFLNIISI